MAVGEGMEANPLAAKDWDRITDARPPTWRQQAEAHGLCRSVPSADGERAKLKDPGLLLRLVLHHVATASSLLQTTAQAHAADLVTVSPVALHKRMRTVGPWLADLTAARTASATTFAPERWAGFRVFATDATTGVRPGPTGTAARVHYRLDLATLQPQQVHVTGPEAGEMLRRFTLGRGDLELLDRGYCNAHDLAHARAAHAHLIVRLNRGTMPLFDTHGQALALTPRVLRLGRPGRVRGWFAKVRAPDGGWIVGRICAVRLSAAAAARAQQKVRDEKGAQAGAADLAWAQFLVVFTTVPRARLSDAAVLELFRLRWQVELQIKRDKSLGGLDAIPNFRDDTIAAWLSGKLLAQALARALSVAAPFPPCVGVAARAA